MGMLEDTVLNLKKLAEAIKLPGTPANVGVTYTVDPNRMMVTGTFNFQLRRVLNSSPYDFSYNVVDFVAPPPPVAVLAPTTFAANTATNLTVTYTGSTPLPPNSFARVFNAANTALGSNVPLTNNAAVFIELSLPAGNYTAYLFSGVEPYPPIPGGTIPFVVT